MVDETDNPRDVLAAEEFVVPAPDPRLRRDAAHDVLAAEEFAMPAPDPRLTELDARDVLAAEEFALPAPDPRLHIHSQPLTLPLDPKDPAGTEPVHDVLAAEEFAVPGTAAQDARAATEAHNRRQRARSRGIIALAGAALALGQLRRRRG
jgi:hypothetical protein